MMISLKKTENINFVNTFKDYFCVGIAFFALQFVAGHLSKQEDIAGVTLHFYDLTLPLISALLVLYRQKAFPILGAFFLYALYSYSLDSLLTLSAQVLAALISQTFYVFSTGKRSAVSFGRSQLTTLRIVWLVCCNSLLFISIEHGFQSRVISEPMTHLFTLQTLINLQWLMNSCLTGIPFCYLLLRSVQNPVWCILHIRHVKTLIKSGPPILCQVLWLVLLVCIMSALIVSRQDILIFTDYSLLWLLPLMLWGVICIGHAFISPVWVAMLILLGYNINSYIPPADDKNYLHSLVIFSTIVFVFSLTIVVAGVLAIRNRKYLRRLKQLFRSEPNTGLPNFQALQMDIRKYSTECLCYIRCTELNTLEQTHGIEFRFEFVKGLSTYVRKLISGDDNIYYAPGHGIILRLNAIPDISELYKKLNAFRFIWKDYQLGLSCGMAYTTEKNLIKNLSLAIKQLNTQSYISLMQGQPLLLNPQMPGDRIVSQAVIRHMLQKAIDRQSFELMAQPIVSTMLVVQPIVSTTGLTRYHEILIRMKMVDGKLIFPDTILPVAREAGLLPALDITVIEQTFRFIQSRQKSEPNSHFSINLTPDSLNKIDFLDNVFTLFRKYAIAPERIIFEVIESDIIDNANVTDVLRALRKAGSKIAIDDFGTGASSYSRLRTLDADILKIDGSFIRNILTDEFSRCAVRSFCEVAKLKKMEVVAEFVENEEIEKMLISMGIGWLQGYHIGKPVPIELAQL
ncbi:Cyclic di-GMP phosphodiesterase YfgF [Citrobacter werkmanii]|uniref:Cyclic di-GMP phosphodiesterase YfgF n=1 Tax=Citrobacter werkmanii TaxID=67827 RepID=A0A9N8CMH4_9ENTR|nr:EAL domain-containing protein [Citrobacter werkmanii]CAB5520540.1 Cyclic di-GMP phosphodiesterase YfgF [Citrobacter werkmanii]CAB5527604.1 Cyclic di-GMP phosphodiesterase YfgF [Citrobacter werkmanii]CAB5537638.1 Cyclic di-GMP phosphodiesterase YfgF [Citrobacter werkmanii]CAB5556656.1 Cyclic di-GMP phosphodiesterase YfgF [Citrobacter werkmanii]CAB5593565.1 Cyclic di-GMP phosphodiesterase YfgF [Citrobacter werkmanii]